MVRVCSSKMLINKHDYDVGVCMHFLSYWCLDQLMYILTQETDLKYKCPVDCEQEVEFEGDEITLDIAEEGVVLHTLYTSG